MCIHSMTAIGGGVGWGTWGRARLTKLYPDIFNIRDDFSNRVCEFFS